MHLKNSLHSACHRCVCDDYDTAVINACSVNIMLASVQVPNQSRRNGRELFSTSATGMRSRSGLRSTAARGASTAACICDVANFEETLVPEILQSHYCGSLFANTCAHCSAYRWPHERETFCCKKGTVRVEPVPPPPNDMKSLFDLTPSDSLSSTQ